MLVILPCGFVHNEKHIKEVELGEMTGYEEDILLDASKGKSNVSLMTEILGRCIDRIGDLSIETKLDSDRAKRARTFAPLIDKMLMTDRSFLWVKLRESSLGPDFYFEATCENCHHIQPRVRTSLAELKVTEMLEEVEEPAEGEEPKEPTPRAPLEENETKLPSGKVVIWRHLIGSDDAFLAKAQKEKKSEFLSSLLFRRALRIDGQKVSSLTHVKSLSTRDRDAFRDAIDKVEGGMDTQIELNCDACGHAWNLTLPTTQKSFFFPSGVR